MDLPEWEQIEYLAYDKYRQDTFEQYLEPFWKKIREDKPVDTASFYALLMEKLR